MRIGIDFGTSYSAAGAIVDGRLELIRFGDDEQFRTTVFFPSRLPDVARFELTPDLQREADGIFEASRRAQSREAARHAGLREQALRLPEARRAAALELVPPAALQSDHELRRAALLAVRRRWSTEQLRTATATGLDLKDALYGDAAVDAYLLDNGGHLVVSPKSMLGFRLHGSARETLLGISTRILEHIRLTAQAQLGCDVRAAVIGRPVRFRSSMHEAGGVQALQILTDAAHAAGFDAVEFLEEPAAAAYGYHAGLQHAQRTLIVDVGGGTTDVAIADVGGHGAAPVVHGSWGEPLGGTDVDIALSMHTVMPLFGNVVTRTPVHHFYEASAVQDMERQARFRATSFGEVEAPFAARLERLRASGHTVRLNRGVEQSRIALSAADSLALELDYIEPGLRCAITRTDVDEAASRFLFHFDALMQVVSDAIAMPETVFLTGGMSRSPYIRAAVQRMFPHAAIASGNASLGVVAGLAHAAAMQAAPAAAAAG